VHHGKTPVNSLVLIPLAPLEQKVDVRRSACSTAVKTASGTAFVPSFLMGLVRQTEDPVTIDAMGNITANHTPIRRDGPTPARRRLAGIDQLWKAARQGRMAFLAAAGHDAIHGAARVRVHDADGDRPRSTRPSTGSTAASIVASVPTVIPGRQGATRRRCSTAAFTQLTGSDQCQQPYTDPTSGNELPGAAGPIPVFRRVASRPTRRSSPRRK